MAVADEASRPAGEETNEAENAAEQLSTTPNRSVRPLRRLSPHRRAAGPSPGHGEGLVSHVAENR